MCLGCGDSFFEEIIHFFNRFAILDCFTIYGLMFARAVFLAAHDTGRVGISVSLSAFLRLSRNVRGNVTNSTPRR